jgi:chloramphenicol 3-O-phosphotransferase
MAKVLLLSDACEAVRKMIGRKPSYNTVRLWIMRGAETKSGYRQLAGTTKSVRGKPYMAVAVSDLREFVMDLLPNRQGPKIGYRKGG